MDSNVVLHAIRQLKGRQPVQVEFNADSKPINHRAFTVPSKCRELDLARYLSSRTTVACGRSPRATVWSTEHFPHVNTVTLKVGFHSELVDNSLSLIPWHQIFHLTVHGTLNLANFRHIIRHTSRLQTLGFSRTFCGIYDPNEEKKYVLTDILEDTVMYDVLRTNGLRKLIFCVSLNPSYGIRLAQLIAKRLPQLQIVEMFSTTDYVSEFLHTLISGLPMLSFLVANCGGVGAMSTWLGLCALQTDGMRPIRAEVQDALNASVIYLWL